MTNGGLLSAGSRTQGTGLKDNEAQTDMARLRTYRFASVLTRRRLGLAARPVAT